MNIFSRISLKNKIFITCLGFVLLVSILIAIFTRSLLISSLTAELQKRGVGIAQGVADSARVYILTQNLAELTSLAYDAKLGNRKDIVKYLVICDDRGTILAHTFTTGYPPQIRNLARASKDLENEITLIQMQGHSIFHATVPVKEGIYTIGNVQIGLDQQHIDNLIANLRLIFLSFLSTVSVLFFFLSHRLALQITKPVAALIRLTDRLTRGDFNIEAVDAPEKAAPASEDSEDEIVRLTNSFLRMTKELKISTDRLTESQEKYRSLFKGGPNPIFVVHKKTFEILDANPNATLLFGYSRQELIGMDLFRLASPEDGQFLQAQTQDQRMVTRAKVKFIRKDGRPVYVNIHSSPSEYRNKDVFIVAATDITELVEKDTQLIQASKMTNIEKMSAGIAHEINQPLNAIKMGSEYLNMMTEKKLPVSETDFRLVTREISTQVTRASEIVSRLKTFSRKADFSREVININACVHAVIKIIGRQITLQNIDLELDLDETAPMVLAHNNRMEQVIFNLLTNARDAINERVESTGDIAKGEITIHTFSDGDHVGLVIEDNGIGIEPDRKKMIFESFFTTKEMGEGLGLGLPIIQGIVKDYSGTISVESVPLKGAIFRLLFPACHDLQPETVPSDMRTDR